MILIKSRQARTLCGVKSQMLNVICSWCVHKIKSHDHLASVQFLVFVEFQPGKDLKREHPAEDIKNILQISAEAVKF